LVYKINNKLEDWKIYLLYTFPSGCHALRVCCSNFFNPTEKNYSVCSATHPSTANVASSVLENSSLEAFVDVREDTVQRG
jgi:hypothetical protein